MEEILKVGDLVKHQFLTEGPEMYVGVIKDGSVVCRYFGAGVFHSEEFTFEEVFTQEKCKVLHKLQSEAQTENSRNINRMFGI